MLRYTTERARPGLVALYNIRPGNGAGQFLQPQSPLGDNHLQQIVTECIVINSCALSLYAIKVLWAHGLCAAAFQQVYKSVVVAKL